ncbi:MAG TPA: hypothetical protein VGB69_01600 [Edaphobacter sp.]
MNRFLVVGVLCCSVVSVAAQGMKSLPDSDRDGLSDELEAKLLKQFQPRWMIGKQDCSVKPARFEPGLAVPTVVEDDGTVYGQAFPRARRRSKAAMVRDEITLRGNKAGQDADEVELHFYHLWRQDCGQMGHALDAEHVAVLLRNESVSEERSEWRAVYWYAAAHEDTVCDASQITRASTLDAEEKGATVWVSPGKHASFLNAELCHYGCGGDRCEAMEEMKPGEIVNLGELSHPDDGAVWVASKQWPLADKMRRSDFLDVRVERLERLPETDIAWANPSKRPAQAAIYGGNSAINGIAIGGRSTDTALVIANDHTGRALDKAQKNTGNALSKSYRSVVKALGGAAESTGKALGMETDGKGTAETSR